MDYTCQEHFASKIYSKVDKPIYSLKIKEFFPFALSAGGEDALIEAVDLLFKLDLDRKGL